MAHILYYYNNINNKGRCLKAVDTDINLTFGEDVQMADAMDMARKVLVGRVRGRNYSVERLRQWTVEIWGSLLKELPVIRVLARGWFALSFPREEYAYWILSSYWQIELAPVLLKRWDPLFDPEREQLDPLFDPEPEQLGAGPIWVRLPGLPMQFWTPQVFKRIGDALGTYLDYDKSFEKTGIMTMARILVHLDTRPGLEEKISLHRRHFSHKQLLDYEGVPFRCGRCHKVGHLYKDCPLHSMVTTENSKGIKQQYSEEQNKGEQIHGETPSEAVERSSKKAGTRGKAPPFLPRPLLLGLAPKQQRSRSKTAAALSSSDSLQNSSGGDFTTKTAAALSSSDSLQNSSGGDFKTKTAAALSSSDSLQNSSGGDFTTGERNETAPRTRSKTAAEATSKPKQQPPSPPRTRSKTAAALSSDSLQNSSGGDFTTGERNETADILSKERSNAFSSRRVDDRPTYYNKDLSVFSHAIYQYFHMPYIDDGLQRGNSL